MAVSVVLKSPNCSDLSLKGVEFEIKNFPDGESYVRIPIDPKGKKVTVIHRCYPDQDSSLIQLLFVLRQLKAMEAKEITAVVPYLPYARQDKRFLQGEAMSSATVSETLREAGCSRLITFDCHFLKKEGEFTYGGLKITNKSLGPLVVEHLKNGLENPLVISPDEGSRYLTENEKDKRVMKKVRGEYGKGDKVYRDIATLEAEFEVKGRDVIIIDDMVAGGGTMIKALKLCLEKGALSVRCGTVHGLFLNDAIARLSAGGASQVVCTNSIMSSAAKVDISNEIARLI
ncbi:MAG: ribose-phosphate diphosphokinase [Candidatus Micrarchaeota archaeon]